MLRDNKQKPFFGVTQISFGPFLCRTEETAGSLGGRGEEDVGGEQSCQQLQRLLTMFDGKIEFLLLWCKYLNVPVPVSEQALEHTRYQSLLKSQSSALELCHQVHVFLCKSIQMFISCWIYCFVIYLNIQETLSQHKELAVKISKINKGLISSSSKIYCAKYL